MAFIPQLKIAQKLPLALVGSALVVSAGVGIASYLIGLGTVQEQRDHSMQASLTTAAELVSDYFTSAEVDLRDRKSTRLNSSHVKISYAVFCLKKKNCRIDNVGSRG